MKELSLHILDLVQNSIVAGATEVVLTVAKKSEPPILCFEIKDNGSGMEESLVKKVTDPFTTSRKTRNVGLGIPLCKMAAELTGGSLSIQSRLGWGTTVRAVFYYNHIDCPPLGDLTDTVIILIQGSPDIDFCLKCADEQAYEFSTVEIRQVLDGVALNEPEVLQWIRENIAEGICSMFQ